MVLPALSVLQSFQVYEGIDENMTTDAITPTIIIPM